MNGSSEQSSSCLMVLTRVCQVIIGDALLWPAWPHLGDVASRFEQVPGASSYTEAAMAMATLLQFTQGLGAQIHRRVHAAYPSCAGACAFNPAAHFVPARIDPANPERWKPGEAMRAWTRDFGQAFARAHQRPVSERARERLRADLADTITLAAVARHEGCSLAVLHRRFANESGETPGRFRTRMRASKAVDLLRNTDWKAEAVARDVGWKSKKDLYKVLKRLTGLTPAEIRSLSQTDVDSLVDRLNRDR